MKTNWNNVASWYDQYLKGEDTYQSKVIAPNLLRVLAPKPGMHLLDVGCGQGYFARLCARDGARVSGIDQSLELISIAREQAQEQESYFIGDAQKLSSIVDGEYDIAYSVLAFENIEDIRSVMEEIKKILRPKGKVVLVLLHSAFRIPGHSDWGYDSKNKIQYRKVQSYLREMRIPIVLHPSKATSESTVTFHRPLQWYMKIFRSSGFAVTNLEEWISHRKSDAGPRKHAEDRARKEIPLFLMLELSRLS